MKKSIKEFLESAKKLTSSCKCITDKIEIICDADGNRVLCGKCGAEMGCRLVSYEKYRKDFGYPVNYVTIYPRKTT